MRMRTTGPLAKVSLGFGLAIGILMFTAFTDWGVNRELEFYILGVIWHIIQAGILFVTLIWVKQEDIQS